jgi:two-component system invasion response regulator UvrY
MMNMIHIGIVDDHAVVRAGLREVLSGCDDMLVVGEAANGREAIDLLNRVWLDVLLLDLKMPGQSGADLLAHVRAKAPGMAVLIVSGYPEEVYASLMLRQGANGYLDKLCPSDRVADAIRTVAQGQLYVTANVAESMAQRFAGTSVQAGHEQLSLREFQVLVKLAQGKQICLISHEVSLSVKTISTYRTRVLRKLGLNSNAELTYYALKNRLIDRGVDEGGEVVEGANSNSEAH